MSLKQLIKAIMSPINDNYDKILHFAVSFMIYTIASKLVPSAAFIAIGVLLIGLAWEHVRKWMYGTPVSNYDMLANGIGVVIAVLVGVL